MDGSILLKMIYEKCCINLGIGLKNIIFQWLTVGSKVTDRQVPHWQEISSVLPNLAARRRSVTESIKERIFLVRRKIKLIEFLNGGFF